MKSWLTGLVFLLLSVTSCAASLEDAFGEGVLGIPWGTTLDQLVGAYPNGDHVFATTPGCRAYWIKDGQTFLSVPRPRSGVMYGLDEKNRVVAAVIAFEFERQLELRSVLSGMFGTPVAASKGNVQAYGWKSKSGMQAVVREFGQGQQRIIWLAIYAAGYKPSAASCYEVPG